MELRKCKECGKMFEPKGREQYCSDIHYRPCPVCGTLVVAKYLSDPARRCDKCKGTRGTAVPKIPTMGSMQAIKPMQPMKMKSLFNIPQMTNPGEIAKTQKIAEPKQAAQPASKYEIKIPERVESSIFCSKVTGQTFRFVRKDALCGWEPGHIYRISVTQDNSAYIITTTFDNTLGREIEFRGRNMLGMRCTSQLSFYNYFQPVWQDSEEAV